MERSCEDGSIYPRPGDRRVPDKEPSVVLTADVCRKEAAALIGVATRSGGKSLNVEEAIGIHARTNLVVAVRTFVIRLQSNDRGPSDHDLAPTEEVERLR